MECFHKRQKSYARHYQGNGGQVWQRDPSSRYKFVNFPLPWILEW